MTRRPATRLTQTAERAQAVVALAAVFALVVHMGGYWQHLSVSVLVWLDVAVIVGFLATDVAKLVAARHRWQYLRRHILDFALIAALIVFLAAAAALRRAGWMPRVLQALGGVSFRLVFLWVIRVYIALVLLLRTLDLQRAVSKSSMRPALTLVISFLVVIALGTALLAAPRAYQDVPIGFVDALFTATSATCVTGLVVKNTGGDFSLFGQLVILVLIQIGGLGLMTFTAFFVLALGRRFGVRESRLIKDVLNSDMLSTVGRLIVSILGVTAAIELVGAALLFVAWPDGSLDLVHRVYYSVFHSVSAFCNAGFCLYADNFERYTGRTGFVVIVATLIVLGGLGFSVLMNLGRIIRARLRPSRTAAEQIRRLKRGTSEVHFGGRRLSLHSKIVLSTTVVLLVVGFILFFVTESFGPTQSPGWKNKVLAAFFQSVTARTAGFSTVKIGALSFPALFLLYVLMFIGASPGSTGGGVKTSTFAINLYAIRAALSDREHVEAFRRTISRDTVRRAFLVVMMGLGVVTISTWLLLLVENYSFEQTAFEVMSAFGTVGLSTGITASLSTVGKLIIVITMFVGRIGPLTVMVAVSSRLARPLNYEYPDERVTIG